MFKKIIFLGLIFINLTIKPMENKKELNQKFVDAIIASVDQNIGKYCADVKTAQELLKRGAKVNSKIAYKAQILLRLVYRNDIEGVKFLLDNKADLLDKPGNQVLPLLAAVRNGNAQIAQLLVDAKSNPHTFDEEEHCPIFETVIENNIDILKIFIKAGADVNALNTYDSSLIEMAAFYNRTEIIKCLLNSGSIDPKNRALDSAIRQQYFEIVKLLLMYGSKFEDAAKSHLTSHLLPYINLHSDIHMLPSIGQFTPLFWSVIFNDYRMIEKYLDQSENFCPEGLGENLISIAQKYSSVDTNLRIQDRLKNIIEQLHLILLFPKPLCKIIRQYLYNY